MVFGTRFSAEKKLKPKLKLAGETFRTASQGKSAALENKINQVAMLLRENPPKMEKARIRTEAVIRDENLIEAYEILRLDCELLVDSIKLIKNSSSCPSDLLLHVSRILYASTRISNSSVPELSGIRDQFLAKYGKKCIDTVEKYILTSSVHQHIVSKLSIDPPPAQAVIDTYLKRIYNKYEVNQYSQQSNNNRNVKDLQPMVVPMAHPMHRQKIDVNHPVQASVFASAPPLPQQQDYNDATATKHISYPSNRSALLEDVSYEDSIYGSDSDSDDEDDRPCVRQFGKSTATNKKRLTRPSENVAPPLPQQQDYNNTLFFINN